MADNKSKIASQAQDPAEPVGPSLGQMITEARERKGLTRDQVVVDAHLPAHYVKMIESDSYGLISDQLYLVPFLRRYATFLGLDPEEVASRFVRDVQRAETNVVRISQEITMVGKRKGVVRRLAIGALITAIVVLLADFAWRRFVEREFHAPAPAPSPAAAISPPSPAAAQSPVAAISPAAQVSPAATDPADSPDDALPPVTIVANPDAAQTSRPARPAAAPANARRPPAPRQAPPPADE
ncbi:MAG TPA: helix-turn-helix domain-containing protein [Candidatus Acidoferrales bacterium]|nr:helix-turn-helix domain-containing protein [Candidatus Acidoferrales bacterium]